MNFQNHKEYGLKNGRRIKEYLYPFIELNLAGF